MKNSTSKVIILAMLVLGIYVNLFAQKEERVSKNFDGVSSVKCKFALGDIIIKKSSDKQVHVSLTYTFGQELFQPTMVTRGKTLVLKEKFYDSNNYGDKGSSQWIIAVPKGCDVDMNTGTGDVEIEGTEGVLAAKTGTGSIDAKNITIVYEGNFNSGTGSVKVTAPKGDQFDLNINSGTGNAILDMAGQSLEGQFTMKCNARRGKIVAPFKFQSEEEIRSGRNKQLEKSYSKGSNNKRYFISTGTGKAVVKK